MIYELGPTWRIQEYVVVSFQQTKMQIRLHSLRQVDLFGGFYQSSFRKTV